MPYLRLLTSVLLIGSLISAGCSKKKKKSTPKPAAARKASRPRARAGLPTGTGRKVEAPRRPGSRKAPEAEPRAARPAAPEPESRPAGTAAQPAEQGPAQEDPEAKKRRLLEAAKQALYSGRYDEAVAKAKSVLAIDEKNEDAIVLIAHAYYRKGKYEICRTVLGFLAAINPNNAYGYYLAGYLALRDRELTKAKILFEKAVERNPNFADAWRILCAWYAQAQNWRDVNKPGKDAYTACSKAVALNPSDYKSVLNLGNTYRGLAASCVPGKVDECRAARAQCLQSGNKEACEQSYAACEKQAVASCGPEMARFYRMARDAYLKALELYQKALRARGKPARPYALALYNLGVLYLDARVLPGETPISRLKKAKVYLRQYAQAADPRVYRREQKRIQEMLRRADMLIQAEKAKLEAQKAQQEAQQQGGGGG